MNHPKPKNVLDGDIVISIKSVGGKLKSARTAIFARKGRKWKQVGLIQKMSLSAHCKDENTDLRMTFPEHPKLSLIVRDAIEDNVKTLEKLGVKILYSGRCVKKVRI